MNKNQLSELRTTVLELLENLLIRIQDLVNSQIEGETKISLEKFHFIIEDIGSLLQGIQYLNNNNNELIMDINEMNEKLSILMDTLEKRDYLSVDDIFSFEIVPLLEFWMESIGND